MNIQSEKIELINWLKSLTDVSILEKIKWLKENQNEAIDWWNEISEAEKSSIEKGMEDSKNKRVTPHEEVRKNYEKWL